VHGLGGLGHLGVQFARAMGFETIAISRGPEKESLARELGAHHYVDTEKEDLGATLTRLGGARIVLATAPSAGAISASLPGLGPDGCLLVVAAPFEPLQVSAVDLIMRNARVQGWSSGSAGDSTDTLAFAKRAGVKAWIETYPLADAQQAYERMISGRARFRAVLEAA
jgi:D-arabinose 1-dehydrogenase-like Zn-dependent alcohol dehydrogenase